jgi:hypothetical protein
MLLALFTAFHSSIFTLALAIVFLLLNILDGHSTWLVLRPDHYLRERNPIARWFFKKAKLPQGIIIFKTALLSVLIPSIAYYTAWDAFTINIVLVVADILFTLVVINNYRVYYRRIKPLYQSFQR